jgi:hypothetical protein
VFEAGSPQRDVWDELMSARANGVGNLDAPLAKGRNPAVTTLLEHAAKALPDYQLNMTRAAAVQLLLETEIPLVTDASARAWLPASFGLTKETKGKSPTECRKVAARIAGATSPDNFRRTDGQEQRGLGILAAQIVANYLGLPVNQDALYVVRESLQEQFDKHMRSGAQLIVFAGLPGIGKSTLARAVAVSRDGTPAPVIRANSIKQFKKDLQAALELYEINLERSVSDDLTALLALLLSSAQGPPVVVLDGLESTAQLGGLLPGSFRSVIVATCRSKDRPPANARIIDVGRLTQAESTEMVRHRLPQLPAEDTAYLAASLHGYPLLIDNACRLLSVRRVPVADFCRDLHLNPSVVAGDITMDEAHATLSTVINGLIDEMRSRDPRSVDLLVLLVFTGQAVGAHSLLKRALSWHTHTLLSDIEYSQIVAVLHDFFFTEPGMPAEFGGQQVDFVFDVIRIHPFISELLCQQFADQIVMVAECMFKAIVSYIGQMRTTAEQRSLAESEVSDIGVASLDVILTLGGLLIEPNQHTYADAVDPELRADMEAWLGNMIRAYLKNAKPQQRQDQIVPPDSGYDPEQWYGWAQQQTASGDAATIERLRERLTIIYTRYSADEIPAVRRASEGS